jgi:Ca-activated chloride channel family protein
MNNNKFLYIPSLLLLSLLTACPSPNITNSKSSEQSSISSNKKPVNRGVGGVVITSETANNNQITPKPSSSVSVSNPSILPSTSASVAPSASTSPVDTTGTTTDIKEKATFNGTIYDSAGNVVNGAKVTATSMDPAVTWNGEDQITGNGSYVFRNAPVGVRLLISVTVDGVTKSQTQVLKSNLTGDPSANQFNFDGYHAIDYRPLRVKVFDINGNSILGEITEVLVESDDPNVTWSEKAVFDNYSSFRIEKIPMYVSKLKVTVKARNQEVTRTYTYNPSISDSNIVNFGGTYSKDKEFAIKRFKTNILADGINLFKETSVEKESTFAVDVDTASYTLMRNSINTANSLPSQDSVRIEEYINYFDYNYPKPEKSFSINTEITNSPFAQGTTKKLLRIGLQGKEIKIENRKDAVITLVIDSSGSMQENNKLETIRSSIKLLLKQLTKRDKISIINYGFDAKTIVNNVDLSKENEILTELDKIKAEGGTNIELGLMKASELAQKNYVSGAINRVILCSDGVNTLGESNIKAILNNIKQKNEISGISFSSIGVGFKNYNDKLLEDIAKNGNGYYAYIDSIKEAVRIFVENTTDTLQVIAEDAKVQVKFNPKSVTSYRLLGYENKLLASSDFRNDNVNAGEIGPNHSVTALYELEVNSDNETDKLADVIMRYKDTDLNGTVIELSKPIFVKDIEESFEKGSYSFRLASTVALYAEILRGSYWSLYNDFDDVLSEINSLEKIKSDAKVSELKKLVEKAKNLSN